MKKTFNRRLYPNVRAFVADLRAAAAHRQQMRFLMRSESLDPAFRERLMLAVTAVNGCRYCSYFHARQAVVAGISAREVEALTAGTVAGCPPDELPAVLYAQHWAESNAHPDPAARERIVDLYGAEKTQAIELALRVIRIGNLTGNTLDYILYRLSFGRWNIDRPPRMARSQRTHPHAR